jgi:hypothetical protein
MKIIRTAEEKRLTIRDECASRGLRIHPYGKGSWIEGDGVDIVCADLAFLSIAELQPYRSVPRK